jgi:hypothetical protein
MKLMEIVRLIANKHRLDMTDYTYVVYNNSYLNSPIDFNETDDYMNDWLMCFRRKNEEQSKMLFVIKEYI